MSFRGGMQNDERLVGICELRVNYLFYNDEFGGKFPTKRNRAAVVTLQAMTSEAEGSDHSCV